MDFWVRCCEQLFEVFFEIISNFIPIIGPFTSNFIISKFSSCPHIIYAIYQTKELDV